MTVAIQTNDGVDFSNIEVKHAKLSETIKNLIEDAGIENPIPLPSVTAKIWKIIQGQFERLDTIVHKIKNEKNSERAADDAQTEIIKELEKLDIPTLIELIEAANYLDIPDLLRLALPVAQQHIINEKLTLKQIAHLPRDIRDSIFEEDNLIDLYKQYKKMNPTDKANFAKTLHLQARLDTYVKMGGEDDSLKRWHVTLSILSKQP